MGRLEFDGAWLEVIEHGIIRITHAPNASLDTTVARQIVDAHTKLANGRKTPVLVDARGIRRADREARELVSGPAVAAITSCLAVLVEGSVSSVIGNFFLRVSRPQYPTRLFTDDDQARTWLLATARALSPTT